MPSEYPLGRFPTHTSFPGSEAELEKALEELRNHAAEWGSHFERWYNNRATKMRRTAQALRGIAFAAIVLGSVIVVGRLLSPDAQKAIMGPFGLATVPAELGLVLFALAAGLLGIDKFGGISDNWMRYIVARMSVERKVVEFQLLWERSVLISDPALQKSVNAVEGERRFEYVKLFLADLFDLVKQETEEWSKNFRSAQSSLEQYLKLQSEVRRSTGQTETIG